MRHKRPETRQLRAGSWLYLPLSVAGKSLAPSVSLKMSREQHKDKSGTCSPRMDELGRDKCSWVPDSGVQVTVIRPVASCDPPDNPVPSLST